MRELIRTCIEIYRSS